MRRYWSEPRNHYNGSSQQRIAGWNILLMGAAVYFHITLLGDYGDSGPRTILVESARTRLVSLFRLVSKPTRVAFALGSVLFSFAVLAGNTPFLLITLYFLHGGLT